MSDIPSNVKIDAASSGLKPDGTHRDLEIHPFIKPLIIKLARANPNWVFHQETLTYNNKENAYIISFVVRYPKDPNSFIGEIGMTGRYNNREGGNENVFTVRSQRLSRERERGSVFQTKDEKAATKAIKKYFNPPPLAERLTEVTERGKRITMDYHHHIHGKLRSSKEECFGSMQKFAAQNWHSYMATLNESEKNKALELVEYQENFKQIKKLSNVTQNNVGITILIEDDKYILRYKDKIYVRLSEELPQDLRGVIGKLKLMPHNGDMLEGEGIKIQANCFLVAPTEGFISEMSAMQK